MLSNKMTNEELIDEVEIIDLLIKTNKKECLALEDSYGDQVSFAIKDRNNDWVEVDFIITKKIADSIIFQKLRERERLKEKRNNIFYSGNILR